MAAWKGGKTSEEALTELLRKFLIRCHRVISKEYPEIANMEPAKAADYLLHLRKTGRIRIELYNKTSTEIGCRILDAE